VSRTDRNVERVVIAVDPCYVESGLAQGPEPVILKSGGGFRPNAGQPQSGDFSG
jgi:hypothetical protein